jgi:hypothetical protein
MPETHVFTRPGEEALEEWVAKPRAVLGAGMGFEAALETLVTD